MAFQVCHYSIDSHKLTRPPYGEAFPAQHEDTTIHCLLFACIRFRPASSLSTMPRAKDPPMPMDFRVLVTQIRWRLEAEGRGQVKELVDVMRHQVAQVGKTLRPRANPLSSFQWRVFQGVSNYFC